MCCLNRQGQPLHWQPSRNSQVFFQGRVLNILKLMLKTSSKWLLSPQSPATPQVAEMRGGTEAHQGRHVGHPQVGWAFEPRARMHVEASAGVLQTAQVWRVHWVKKEMKLSIYTPKSGDHLKSEQPYWLENPNLIEISHPLPPQVTVTQAVQ